MPTTKSPPARGHGAASSADDIPGCKPTDAGPSAAKPNEDRWHDTEAEADGDDELGRDNNENNRPFLRSMKKRYRSTACEKSTEKRGVKRYRFSSPLSSDQGIETGEKSDHSSHEPCEAHSVSKAQPASSYSIGLEGGRSDDSKMAFAGERSRMAVIYEQQSWEGEVIDERDTKQGRGRPPKQYLVRWKPSWMDGGRLTDPSLMQIWREKKASRRGH